MKQFGDFMMTSRAFRFEAKITVEVVQLTGRWKYSVTGIVAGSEVFEGCGSQHESKEKALEAALSKAKELNLSSQRAFDQWISQTSAEV